MTQGQALAVGTKCGPTGTEGTCATVCSNTIQYYDEELTSTSAIKCSSGNCCGN